MSMESLDKKSWRQLESSGHLAFRSYFFPISQRGGFGGGKSKQDLIGVLLYRLFESSKYFGWEVTSARQ